MKQNKQTVLYHTKKGFTMPLTSDYSKIIEYSEKQIYSFTSKGVEFRYFRFNPIDSYPDYIYVPHTDKYHVGHVDLEEMTVTYRNEINDTVAIIDDDSHIEYNPA